MTRRKTSPKRPAAQATYVFRFDDGSEHRLPAVEVTRAEIELMHKGLNKPFTRPAAERLRDAMAEKLLTATLRTAQSRSAAKAPRMMRVAAAQEKPETLRGIVAQLAQRHPDETARQIFDRLPEFLADREIRCDVGEPATDWRKSILIVDGRRITGASIQRYLQGRRRA